MAEYQKIGYTEIVRTKVTINERGVITIPAALRQALGLKPNDELILEQTDGGLLLRPAFSVPIELYSEDRIAEFTADDEAVGKALDRAKSRRRSA